MREGARLLRFLTRLILEDLYGAVTIRFEAGKATDAESECRRMWQYEDLPDYVSSSSGSVSDRPAVGALVGDYASCEPDKNG